MTSWIVKGTKNIDDFLLRILQKLTIWIQGWKATLSQWGWTKEIFTKNFELNKSLYSFTIDVICGIVFQIMKELLVQKYDTIWNKLKIMYKEKMV